MKCSPKWKPKPPKYKIPIVGPVVATFFQQLVMMTGAKTVFEMGSAIGYSTIWWARAVGEGGRVHYTDGDPKNADKARRYFQRAGVADRIKIHTGRCHRVAFRAEEAFDIVFNDIDKDDYPRVLRMVPPRFKKGGLFVTDNVLWSGRVTDRKIPMRARKPFRNSIGSSTSPKTSSRRLCPCGMEWQ